jgi:hypothetical protein
MAYVDKESPEDHIAGYLLVNNNFAHTDALSDHGMDAAWKALYDSEGFMVIPVSSLAGLTEEEAEHSAGTGDWRYVVRAMVESFYDAYTAMATADKPDNMTVTESSLISTTDTAESNRTWTFTATLNTGALEVADE